MKTRCYNPQSKTYHYYGGRGVTICDEWINNFQAFQNWAIANGYSEDLTIDRIDNDKGYSPDNCRWATWHEQRINQRREKEAAPVLEHRDGQKVEIGLPTNISTSILTKD